MDEIRRNLTFYCSVVTFLVSCLLVIVLFADSDTKPKPNYEAMANCIAEYDYHHYNNNMMNNLVAALEKCQR